MLWFIYLLILGNWMHKSMEANSNRSLSLQNLKVIDRKIHSPSWLLQKRLHMATQPNQSNNQHKSELSAFHQHQQLRQILNRLNKNTLDFIDRIVPKKVAKRLINTNSKQQLQDNNKKISNLYIQIKQTQSQLSFAQHKSQQYQNSCIQIQNQKDQLKKRISQLKLKIQSNTRQLIQRQCKSSFYLFDLQNQIAKADKKLKQINQKNQQIASKNEAKRDKIKQIQEKIKQYQSNQIFAELKLRSQLQTKFRQRQSQLQKLKERARRQRSRLQFAYFQKLKDLQYGIAGIDAINNKIAQLQGRIGKVKMEVYIPNQDCSQAHLKIQTDQNSSNTLPTKIQRSSSEIGISGGDRSIMNTKDKYERSQSSKGYLRRHMTTIKNKQRKKKLISFAYNQDK